MTAEEINKKIDEGGPGSVIFLYDSYSNGYTLDVERVRIFSGKNKAISVDIARFLYKSYQEIRQEAFYCPPTMEFVQFNFEELSTLPLCTQANDYEYLLHSLIPFINDQNLIADHTRPLLFGLFFKEDEWDLSELSPLATDIDYTDCEYLNEHRDLLIHDKLYGNPILQTPVYWIETQKGCAFFSNSKSGWAVQGELLRKIEENYFTKSMDHGYIRRGTVPDNQVQDIKNLIDKCIDINNGFRVGFKENLSDGNLIKDYSVIDEVELSPTSEKYLDFIDKFDLPYSDHNYQISLLLQIFTSGELPTDSEKFQHHRAFKFHSVGLESIERQEMKIEEYQSLKHEFTELVRLTARDILERHYKCDRADLNSLKVKVPQKKQFTLKR